MDMGSQVFHVDSVWEFLIVWEQSATKLVLQQRIVRDLARNKFRFVST